MGQTGFLGDRCPGLRGTARGVYALISRLTGFVILSSLLFAAACRQELPPTFPGNVQPETVNPLLNQSNSAETAQEGERLFLRNCANCHGYTGQGDGPSRGSLVAPPANLTLDPVSSYPDGRLFLAIKYGKRVDGKLTMPPVLNLTDEEIWKTVIYLRALAARDR